MNTTLSKSAPNTLSISLERRVVALLLVLFFGILLAVGLSAIFYRPAPHVLAIIAAVSLFLAILFTKPVARRLPLALDGRYQTHTLICLLWLALSLSALTRIGGVAVYMADEKQAQVSAIWFDDFYNNHNCFSAYWKAYDLTRQNSDNIYDSKPYEGHEGRFKLDEYLYPPQFLILPKLAHTFGADFLQMRAAWFAVDAALLAIAMLAICHWIGGALGLRIGLSLPALWVALPTLITLQTGNFQLAAIALAMLGMLLFMRGRTISGAAVFGIALFKIFPGILCLYLAFKKRWSALFWTIVFSIIYLVVAYLLFGAKPFTAFLDYQLPRMGNGEQWAWLQLEGLESVVAINQSIPGLAFKMKLLGIANTSLADANLLAWIWTGLLLLATLIVARRQNANPVTEVAICLSLLGLAALRSPFVPDDYALFPVLWIWCVAVGLYANSIKRNVLFFVLWIFFAVVVPFAVIDPRYVFWILTWSSLSQLFGVGLMLWMLFRRFNETDRPTQSL